MEDKYDWTKYQRLSDTDFNHCIYEVPDVAVCGGAPQEITTIKTGNGQLLTLTPAFLNELYAKTAAIQAKYEIF